MNQQVYIYPIFESITSLRFDPSSIGHVESYVNQQGYIYHYILLFYSFKKNYIILLILFYVLLL